MPEKKAQNHAANRPAPTGSHPNDPVGSKPIVGAGPAQGGNLAGPSKLPKVP